ncbi:hypothetical protein [Vibrio agarivorans]|uniref:hypothetical protein n=1 Tax=Vibrio agarivorans TaxID=153622 RepID=UPI0025B36807|nr:hypothetical protein [Vibrio agarivorans]MDN3660393.1 hypothetical protein [Vibrio agarivorans]
MTNKFLVTAIGAIMLGGCASNQDESSTAKIETNSAIDVPAWVLNPASANGLAASNCVEASGNFSLDRNHAVALSRNTLAQNLDVKVSVLEKTYQQLNQSIDGTTTGSSFEQVAKQVTNTSIKKSEIEQIALVNIAGKDQVCALVVMPQIESEQLFNQAIPTTAKIDPTDKAAMYKEFLSQKTAKQLEAQVQNL